MTLYLDTSALVKLYVDEPDSAAIRTFADQADLLVTSLLTYVEACSAFARRRRERSVSGVLERQALEQLDDRWSSYVKVDVTEPLIASAAQLVSKHGLRGYDAVHLASALELQRAFNDTVTFAAFDASLIRAAKREKLKLLRSIVALAG